METTITVKAYSCNRCGYAWQPRRNVAPKVCPACKRTDWNEARDSRKVAAS